MNNSKVTTGQTTYVRDQQQFRPRSVRGKVLLYSISVIGLVLMILVTVLAWSNVSKSVTEEDKVWIPRLLSEAGVNDMGDLSSYEQELAFIRHVQQAVLNITTENRGIPFGHPREAKDLVEAGAGMCYDRSRVMEKVLLFKGFRVRHIYILYTKRGMAFFKSLLSRQNPSHAITEVLTKKGWIVLGSNTPFISIDTERNPVSMSRMLKEGITSIRWHPEVKRHVLETYGNDFVYYYGLYSRHGLFYPPYNYIPDINWPDFMANLATSSHLADSVHSK